MKKWIPAAALVMVLLVIVLLALPHNEIQDRVTFYYARQNYLYGEPEAVMGAEVREVGPRIRDLTYLLALYLEGPMDPDLLVPFPGKDIDQVQTLTMEKEQVRIILPELGSTMTDGEFYLSCACLTRTCLELTGAQSVQITSGERSVTMDLDNLLLFDESTSVETPKTEEKE